MAIKHFLIRISWSKDYFLHFQNHLLYFQYLAILVFQSLCEEFWRFLCDSDVEWTKDSLIFYSWWNYELLQIFRKQRRKEAENLTESLRGCGGDYEGSWNFQSNNQALSNITKLGGSLCVERRDLWFGKELCKSLSQLMISISCRNLKTTLRVKFNRWFYGTNMAVIFWWHSRAPSRALVYLEFMGYKHLWEKWSLPWDINSIVWNKKKLSIMEGGKAEFGRVGCR